MPSHDPRQGPGVERWSAPDLADDRGELALVGCGIEIRQRSSRLGHASASRGGSATVSQLLGEGDELDERTVRALADINRAFYHDSAAEFGATREASWPGWARLLPWTEKRGLAAKPDVLDVGCGNGRFAAFLDDEAIACDYLGVDASAPLIEAARRRRLTRVRARYAIQDFIAGSLEGVLASRAFDLIVLFGVLHHVPGGARRRALLAGLAQRLRAGGLLALTAWQFAAFRRFRERLRPWEEFNRDAAEPIDLSQLEAGDHLLVWGDEDRAGLRYCHFAADAEIRRLLDPLPLTCVDTYSADGRGGELNRYFILRAPP
jgi:SAM-dependent methyltransferase